MAIDFDFKNVLNPTGQVDNHVLRELLNDLKIYLNDTLETDISIQVGNIDSESATDGHVLTADGSGGAAFSALTTGKILQVVTGTTSTATNTSSTSYVDTALAVTITPSATANKILLITHAPVYVVAAGQASLTIKRTSTDLGGAPGLTGVGPGTAIDVVFNTAMVHLDSPSTTSATTYTVRIKTASPAVVHNVGTRLVTIMAIEVEG